MTCFICQSKGPYWLLLKNNEIHKDQDNNCIGKTIQTCSYSCTQKLTGHLPKNYGNLILNKEDFCYWCVPVKPIQKTFEILSFEEIQKMDVHKKEDYLLKLKEYCMDNNKNYEFYQDIYDEDERIYNMENNLSSDDETIMDDY